ncbi:Thiopurine S-methyltransferase [Thiorhodovibrio winogradskyi]|uniref:Thiopurine S-methyltransferase n=1 Tax=Thiorhodovibrio winogradskyi TaxID=77007 RepID=A0ABZ0S801_9GAMM|nr:thiopurine S-methyltransferase [Thiorhodovibrio winogradskyi]
MTPEFWHARWERGEIGWHEPEINTHLREFWPRLNLSPGTTALVPLCGKTLDLLWLVGEGYRVIGIELSKRALQEFFDEHGLSPKITELGPFQRWSADELTLLCGDFFALRRSHLTSVARSAVTAVYDRAALIAMPPELRPDYIRHLANLLAPAPGARLDGLLVTIEYLQQEMRGPPFSVPATQVRELCDGLLTTEELADYDIIAESPQFQRRGLSALREQVWRLAMV